MHTGGTGHGTGGSKVNFNLWLLLLPAIALTIFFLALWIKDGGSGDAEETEPARSAATRTVVASPEATTDSTRSATMRRNATCDQPAQTVDVPYGGSDGERRSRWVNVRGGCIADPTPGIGSGQYRVWCKDMEWNVHPWSDEACWYYRALAFQRTGTPAPGTENETLSLDIPFRPIVP